MGLWSFNGTDDGLTGRSVASLDARPGDLPPDPGDQRRRRVRQGGAGRLRGGAGDRFDIAPFGGFNIGLMAAYDYQFRNAGWDEGILWAGLDFGLRF